MQSKPSLERFTHGSLLSESPIRIGSFILERLGSPEGSLCANDNTDVSEILANILKRYDLLLVTERRTGNETNIDRLIKRLNTVDRNSPFDFEESEASCSIHKISEHYCFFYRIDKLSVVDVHNYGRSPFSPKGWKKHHNMQASSSGHSLSLSQLSRSHSDVSVTSTSKGLLYDRRGSAPPYTSRARASSQPVLPVGSRHTAAKCTKFKVELFTDKKPMTAGSRDAGSSDAKTAGAASKNASLADATPKGQVPKMHPQKVPRTKGQVQKGHQ